MGSGFSGLQETCMVTVSDEGLTRILEQGSNRSSPASSLLSHLSSQRLRYTAGIREHQHKSWPTLTENVHLCLSPGVHIDYNENTELINLSASPMEVVSRTCFCLNPQKGIWPPSFSSEEGCGVVPVTGRSVASRQMTQ